MREVGQKLWGEDNYLQVSRSLLPSPLPLVFFAFLVFILFPLSSSSSSSSLSCCLQGLCSKMDSSSTWADGHLCILCLITVKS
mmetsp:Transcript_26402/g.86789  ORF Transcript_26402/g.86789 Transcript_26402/m.86789 type:complete len:83 (-) Transcript_26402:668-916(-)